MILRGFFPAVCRRLSPGLCLLFALTLVACFESGTLGTGESESKRYPVNYQADIVAFLRSYLNDPTNIRDPAISEPSFQQIGPEQRYVVCLRFNAKGPGGTYAGLKDNLVIFTAGRLDRMVPAQDRCASASYQPFPEISRLAR